MSKEKIEPVVEKVEKVEEAVKAVSNDQEEQFNELIEGLKRLAKFAGEVASDGKVNTKDLDSVVELFSDVGVLVKAFDGIDRALPPSVDRRFSVLALAGIFDIVDAFKEGKESEK